MASKGQRFQIRCLIENYVMKITVLLMVLVSVKKSAMREISATPLGQRWLYRRSLRLLQKDLVQQLAKINISVDRRRQLLNPYCDPFHLPLYEGLKGDLVMNHLWEPVTP